MTFNSGDGYEIYKLLVALDQPGRGKGDLLADGNPVATGAWPRQALEPVYAWGNKYNNLRQLDVASPYPTIQENRDFYNQKTPFDGTAGVGVGLLAERPKACTPGVGVLGDGPRRMEQHSWWPGRTVVCLQRAQRLVALVHALRVPTSLRPKMAAGPANGREKMTEK